LPADHFFQAPMGFSLGLVLALSTLPSVRDWRRAPMPHPILLRVVHFQLEVRAIISLLVLCCLAG
jgi:hypothetical protein